MTNEQSAAARFLDEHETLQHELATARATIAEQGKLLDGALIEIELLKTRIEILNAEKNRYLQYCFELSAQLQFIVAGAARALQIAQSVRANIVAGADIPDVRGADAAELERIIANLPPRHDDKPNDERKPDLATVVTIKADDDAEHARVLKDVQDAMNKQELQPSLDNIPESDAIRKLKALAR